jgi:hypothetical protein
VTFKKHYTREEARALLPQVRQWTQRLSELLPELVKLEELVSGLAAEGCDAGGPTVNNWVRALAEVRSLLLEFERRQILLKDPRRGLVDFPALLGDKEVFLCWEMGEEDIEFWHDLDAGYAGREPL